MSTETQPVVGQPKDSRQLLRELLEFGERFTRLARSSPTRRLGEHEAKILRLLLERGSPISQARLSQRLERGNAWTSRTVHKLIAAGFVEHDLSDGPARNLPIQLTSAGKTRAKELVSRDETLWKKTLQKVSPRHRSEVHHALTLLHSAMSQVLEAHRAESSAAIAKAVGASQR